MDVSNNALIQLLLEDIININNAIIFNSNSDIFNENFSPFPIFPFYNSPINAHQTVLNESLYDRNPIKNVVTQEIAEGLLPIKFKDAKDKENNQGCSITMEIFKEDDDIIQLPCNHCFLVEPIMQWLTEENCECPVCRYKFESMEKNTRLDEPLQEEIVGVENIPYNNIFFSQIMNNLFLDDDDVSSLSSSTPDLDVDVD